MLYQKKKIVIKAWQYVGSFDNSPDFIKSRKDISHDENKVLINRSNGVIICNLNDYLIIGTHGECYACKPDIFHSIYEIVNEEEHTFSSKSVIIQAWRYTGFYRIAPEFIKSRNDITFHHYHHSANEIRDEGLRNYALMKTSESELRVNFGDYFIIGNQNECYPCPKEVFESKYEVFKPKFKEDYVVSFKKGQNHEK